MVITLGSYQTLTELLSLFRNIYAKFSLLCWHLSGHCQVLVILRDPFTSKTETGPTLTRFFDSWALHCSQCWEPAFNTKYIMHAASGYGTRAAGVPGRCANRYTVLRELCRPDGLFCSTLTAPGNRIATSENNTLKNIVIRGGVSNVNALTS